MHGTPANLHVTQLEHLEWLRVKRINERFFLLLLYSFFFLSSIILGSYSLYAS